MTLRLLDPPDSNIIDIDTIMHAEVVESWGSWAAPCIGCNRTVGATDEEIADGSVICAACSGINEYGLMLGPCSQCAVPIWDEPEHFEANVAACSNECLDALIIAWLPEDAA